MQIIFLQSNITFFEITFELKDNDFVVAKVLSCTVSSLLKTPTNGSRDKQMAVGYDSTVTGSRSFQFFCCLQLLR